MPQVKRKLKLGSVGVERDGFALGVAAQVAGPGDVDVVGKARLRPHW